MTATEIITYATYLADTVSDTKFDATKCLAYVNEGLKQLWYYLISTKNPIILKSANISVLVGTQSYTLSSVAADFLDIVEVFDNTNYSKLREVSFSDKLSYLDNEQVYYRLGVKIYLCYTPQQTRTLEMIYAPTFTALAANDSPTTWLAAEYQELVSYFVAIRMLEEDGQRPSNILRVDYDTKMSAFRDWGTNITSPASFQYNAVGETFVRQTI